MTFSNHAELVRSLEEEARNRYPQLSSRCRSAGVSVTRRKDGKADGRVTFYVPSPTEDGEVTSRTSTFICHDPNSSELVWAAANDWND